MRCSVPQSTPRRSSISTLAARYTAGPAGVGGSWSAVPHARGRLAVSCGSNRSWHRSHPAADDLMSLRMSRPDKSAFDDLTERARVPFRDGKARARGPDLSDPAARRTLYREATRGAQDNTAGP